MKRADTGHPVHEGSDYQVRVQQSAEGGAWVVVTPPAPAPEFVMTAVEAEVLAGRLRTAAMNTRR